MGKITQFRSTQTTPANRFRLGAPENSSRSGLLAGSRDKVFELFKRNWDSFEYFFSTMKPRTYHTLRKLCPHTTLARTREFACRTFAFAGRSNRIERRAMRESPPRAPIVAPECNARRACKNGGLCCCGCCSGLYRGTRYGLHGPTTKHTNTQTHTHTLDQQLKSIIGRADKGCRGTSVARCACTVDAIDGG